MSADQRRPSDAPRGRMPLDTLDRFDSLRPSSLPPELGELDFSWDDDLSPQEQRPKAPRFAPLELDLDLEEGDRPTAVPDIPMEQFVAHAMAAVERDEQESSLPSSIPVTSAKQASSPVAATAPRLRPSKIDAYQPQSAIPSNRPSAMSSRTPIPALPRLDPLALDIAELEVANLQDSVTPTEPPAADRSYQTTLVPPGSDRQRDTDLNSLAADTMPPPEDASRSTMKDRYAVGDFSGALEISEILLAADPADLEAQRYATSCRDVLTQMYLSRLGGLDQIIRLVLPPEELRWLNLDHRAGFLLSLVDGVSTIEELLDISGMTRLDALKILSTLREQRAILLSSR